MSNKGPEMSLNCVITSYSIHYTKLYDILIFLSAPGWARFWEQTDGPYWLGISSMVINVSDDLLARTSLVFANDFLALAICL